MKSLFSVFLAFFAFSLSAFAEYQAFNYQASIKVPKMELKKVDGVYEKTWQLKSESLKGILVTVCCYPCQESFGKGYPSWLYVQRSGDKKTLWKIPMVVDGGVFGGNGDVTRITDESKMDRFDLSKADENYVKRFKKAWLMMNAKTVECYEVNLSTKICGVKTVRGFLGDETLGTFIRHFGFGTTSFKREPKLAKDGLDFQPYISSVSGSVGGEVKTAIQYSFDPSNFTGYENAPVAGTFSIKFNASLTKLVAGTADWNVIDYRIFSKFKYDMLVEEEYLNEYMYDTCFSSEEN